MKRFNKRGSLELLTIVWLSISAMGISVSMLPNVRADFQKKKAIETCKVEGFLNCESVMNSRSKQWILAYIADDKVSAISPNGGNFVGGYQN